METRPSTTTPAAKTTPQSPDAARVRAAADPVAGRPAAKRQRVSTRTIVLAVMAAIIVAVIALSRLPAPDDASDAADVSTETPAAIDREANAQPTAAAPASGAMAPAAAVQRSAVRDDSEPPKKAAAKPKVRATRAAASSAASRVSTPVAKAHDTSNAAAGAIDAEPSRTAAETAAPTVGAVALSEVTITGCLEISTDEESFRLTDTDATPKSRSWRTGFLKKRSATVDLVGPSDTATLQRQVGRRVAATGVLTSRELKVSAIRVVGASCN